MGSVVGAVSTVSAVIEAPVFTSTNILVRATFNGVSAPGPVSIPGLQVGDIILELTDGTNLIGYGYMERTVSKADQLQQVFDGDLSPSSYTAIFARGL